MALAAHQVTSEVQPDPRQSYASADPRDHQSSNPMPSLGGEKGRQTGDANPALAGRNNKSVDPCYKCGSTSHTPNSCTLDKPAITIYTIPAIVTTISSPQEEAIDPKRGFKQISVRVLLESGALSRDMVSRQTVDRIVNSMYNKSVVTTHKCNNCKNSFRICSDLDRHCINSNDIPLVIKLISENQEHFTINTKAIILEDTPCDVILGRDTLRSARLVKHFPHYFVEAEGGEVPPTLRQSRDITSKPTTVKESQAKKKRGVTPAVRKEDTENEVDDSHTITYACASVLAGSHESRPSTSQCIAERRSDLQTARPAVDSSLGDTQVETAHHPVTVTQTVNARPTSSSESGMPRIYDDDGLGEEQWEVTAAYPIHETTEDYNDLIAKVQTGGPRRSERSLFKC